MNRYKQLIKNIGLLTIGNFASKLLSFILVPLYTSVLSTQEYGTFDIISTTVTLLLPILSVNIVEAVLRFPIDRQNDDGYVADVYSVGVRYSIIGCIFLVFFLLINHVFSVFDILVQYENYMLLLYIVLAFNQLLVSFARAIDRIKDVTIAGVITSAVMICLNLLFLLKFKLGLEGYFWAVIISNGIADLYYVIRLKVVSYTKLKLTEKTISRSMLVYSFPMIFNTVGWWINNASDRYIVTWLCGISVNGIYSVSYKIPSILNVFHSIFMQAWIISAVQEYKNENNELFFRNVYNTYGGLMAVLCFSIIVFTKPISALLFQKEFFQAWYYIPFLLIAVLFGTLSGGLGGVFSAEKASNMFAISTCIGAGVNFILNILLVKPMGPLGAALATMLSAYIVLVFRIRHAKRYIDLKLHLFRDHVVYILLVAQSMMVMMLKTSVLYFIISAMFLAVLVLLYKNEINSIICNSHNLVKRKLSW